MLTVSKFTFIHESEALIKAFSALETSEYKILFIIDLDGVLVGTITDGDIRRGLLAGHTLDGIVANFMNKKFLSVAKDGDLSLSLEIARKLQIEYVPVVNEIGAVINVLTLADHQTNRLDNPVLLMAGGKGSRLGKITENCPKPLLEIGGRPVLESLLLQCIYSGFRNFFISINYLGDQIQEYFGDGDRWGVSIEYLDETQPLGTAGPLGFLKNRVTAPVLVLNGDILCRVDYDKFLMFHIKNDAAVTVGVRQHISQVPFGVLDVEENQRISKIMEKPTYQSLVCAGMYIISPHLIDLIPLEPLDMPDFLMKSLIDEHPILAYMIYEDWIDIGIPETLKKAQLEWKNEF